ncbi:hypothetical protein [Natronorubrum sp. FCH18a]|uniref:hypothetical protein n=1 Tax=Natronorubrum sp. FCH18a TaxID=3447018 RepID=UPI003F51669C
MTDENGRGGFNPLKRPLCWISDHEWVDDAFMGDGQECARCGAFDEANHLLRQWAVIFAIGYLAGALTLGSLVIL